jgi:hypothetical protein
LYEVRKRKKDETRQEDKHTSTTIRHAGKIRRASIPLANLLVVVDLHPLGVGFLMHDWAAVGAGGRGTARRSADEAGAEARGERFEEVGEADS